MCRGSLTDGSDELAGERDDVAVVQLVEQDVGVGDAGVFGERAGLGPVHSVGDQAVPV